MITYILIAIVVACLIHVVFNYNETARTLRKIPGPKDYFIVGNAGEVNGDPVALFKLREKYAKLFKGIYRIWVYPFGVINLYNPDDIEVVMSTTKHSEKSIIYKFLKPWLNEGLGTKWQQRRKILTPTFHFNILRQFYVIMEENSSRLVDKLDTILGQTVDVTRIISEFTLNTICETAMGTQLNKDTYKTGNAYKEAIHELGDILVQRFVTLRYYSDFLFNISLLGRKHNKYIQTIHNFTKRVIADRKTSTVENVNTMEDHNNDNDDNIYYGKKRRTAMLDVLISAEKEGLIDENGLQEEVDTFMFEGHDTTSTGLTFMLMLLANNRSVQDNIFAELKEILGDTRRAITINDLSNMRYLECCIKESLRLYPPVHFISRNITETVELSDYIVPAGTICHIHIYDLHRRADLFENPLEFIPERFLPENYVDKHPFAYIPFSAGPRNCIGQKFATLEMKSAIVAILRNYTLTPVTRPEDLKMLADIVLRNSAPIYVKFEKRVEIV